MTPLVSPTQLVRPLRALHPLHTDFSGRRMGSSLLATAALTAVVAVAYVVLGALGLPLASAPGYVTPVFPAAGLALVALLLMGQRAVGGVLVGSLLLNVGVAAVRDNLGTEAIGMALVIALGSTLQAWTGAYLLRHWNPETLLGSDERIFAFVWRGGLVAGLVAATIGALTLRSFGMVPDGEFLYTGWTWYVGDVLGILVFAPLLLAVLLRDAPGAECGEVWRLRRRWVLLPMGVVLGLAALVFETVQAWEERELARTLDNDGTRLVARINERINAHREVLTGLRSFVQSVPGASYTEFERFTRSTLADKPDIYALSYNDWVTLEQRTDYERNVSQRSPMGEFGIRERNAMGQLTTADDRPHYVVVRYIAPLAGNEAALGFDIHSESVRRAAIQKVQQTRQMAVTAPIVLVQESQPRVGLLALQPVYLGGFAGAGSHPDGFAVAVTKVDEMLAIASRGALPAGLSFHLVDVLAPPERSLLYHSDAPIQGPGPAPALRADHMAWNGRVTMADREWRVILEASPAYQALHRPWLAWLVGVGSLLLAALLQMMLLGSTAREARAQQRSRELARQEGYYEQLFTAAPLAQWLIDPRSQRVLQANPRAAELLGATTEELKGSLVSEYSATLEPLETRHGLALYKNRLGANMQVLVHSAEVMAHGETALLQTLQDVTRLQRDKARNALYQQAFQHSRVAMVLTDPSAAVVTVNPAFVQLTGYRLSDVAGQNLRLLNSGMQSAEFYRSMWHTLLRQRYWRGQVWNRNAQGDVFGVWLTISAVLDEDGALLHYLGSMTPVERNEESA